MELLAKSCGLMLGVGVFLYLSNMALLVGSSSLSDVSSLHTNLLNGYNKYVRPADNTHQPLVVNITFYLVGIQDFDEVSGKFSVTAFMIVTWADSRMTWNPLDYNHTYYLPFAGNLIWKPNLILINPFDSIDKIGKDFMEVRFFYTGDANWAPGDVLSSSCEIDVTYYPFDTQVCKIIIMYWGAPSTEIFLQSTSNQADTTYFSPHGTWKLTKTKTEAIDDGGMSSYNIYITVSRRPLFFVVNVVLPILFMAFLNSLVFILPVESGERVSYAITVLLAIAVFLTLVGDNLPKTSKPMSVLCYFLLADLVMSSVVSILTIIGLKYYHMDSNKPVPSWLCRFVYCMNCSRSSKKSSDRVTPLPATLSTSDLKFDVIEKKSFSTRKTVSGKQQVTTVMNVKSRKPDISVFDEKSEVVELRDDDTNHVTWRDLSDAIDKISFIGCMFWMIGLCVVFFTYITAQ